MFNLEDRLHPQPSPHAGYRDALAVVLVLLLAGPLLRDWFSGVGSALSEMGRIRQEIRQNDLRPRTRSADAAAANRRELLEDRLGRTTLSLQQLLQDMLIRMFSPLLLAVLGFALALRRGAIDLGVWVVAGVGGLLAATILRASWAPHAGAAAPLLAFLAAAAAGGVIGLANGLLVARRR